MRWLILLLRKLKKKNIAHYKRNYKVDQKKNHKYLVSSEPFKQKRGENKEKIKIKDYNN